MTTQWQAVTGDRFLLPYQLHQRVYGWPLTLPWFPVRQLDFRHADFAKYYAWEIREHESLRIPEKIAAGLVVKLLLLWRFYGGPVLGRALLHGGTILRRARSRVVWLAGGAVLAAVLVEQSGYPHSVAPAAPALLLFVVEGFRYLAQWRLGKWRPGRVLPAAVFRRGAATRRRSGSEHCSQQGIEFPVLVLHRRPPIRPRANHAPAGARSRRAVGNRPQRTADLRKHGVDL